jgi:hypothetical protein
MFRTFWAELTLDTSRGEPQPEQNPPLYESDMLTLTTDVRMQKVGQILRGNPGMEVGGQVECLFWIPAMSTQWRLNGKAFVVGAADGDFMEEMDRAEIWKRMRVRSTGESVSNLAEEAAGSWTWEREITAHFANMSPLMRGRCQSSSSSFSNSSFWPSCLSGSMLLNLNGI